MMLRIVLSSCRVANVAPYEHPEGGVARHLMTCILRACRALPVILLVLTVSMQCGEALADTTVRVGAYENPPKIYTVSDGQVVGIFPEILAHIAELEGWKIRYIHGTWQECLDRLERGELDLMVDVAYSEERAQRFGFCKETVFVNWAVVCVPAGSEIASYQDLRGRTVAVMKGSIHTVGERSIGNFLNNFDISCNFVEVDDYQAVLELLQRGEADAGVVNRLFADLHADQYGVEATRMIFDPRQLRFAYSKSSETGELSAEKIDHHLRLLKAGRDTIYHRTLRHHLASSQEGLGQDFDYSLLWKILGCVALFIGLVVALFMLWNRSLSAEVKKRTRELTAANAKLTEEMTERKRVEEALRKSNRELKTLSECNQILVRATEEGELLQEICRILVDIGGYRLAWVGIAEHDEEKTVRPAAQVGYEEGYLDTMDITWAETERGRGPTGRAIRSGEYVISRHISTDSETEPWRAEAFKRGCLSSIVFPLAVSGEVFGALSIYSALPDAFDNAELRMLTELVNDTAFGIFSIRTRQQRERAERMLAESEEKFRSLAENAPNIIMLATEDGKILFINRKMAGLSTKETEGTEIYDYFHEEYHNSVREIIKRVLDTGEADTYEVKGVGPGGRMSWYSTSVGKVKWGGRTPAVILVNSDITGRKKAEENLKESESKLKAIFTEASDGILIADVAQKKFVMANAAICRMLGYTRDELLNRGVEDIHPADSLPHVYEEFQKQISGETIIAADLPLKHKDGGVFYADVSSAPITLAGKTHLLGIFRDITERRKREEVQRKLEAENLVVEELRRLDGMKDEFVSIITHELRTPMTPLKSSVEMFLDGSLGEITEKQQNFLTMMARNIDRLSQFTTEVLSLSRLQAGRYALNPKMFSVGEAADSVIELLKEKAHSKKSTIRLDTDAGLQAYADANALAQIVTNLVNNAIVHAGEGAEIVISGRKLGGGFVEVSVADNGQGIPEEALSHLFDRFYQSDRKNAPGYQGTGIGLSLCQGLVEAMGGEISVESNKGEGTTFRFTLPASPPQKDAPAVQ